MTAHRTLVFSALLAATIPALYAQDAGSGPATVTAPAATATAPAAGALLPIGIGQANLQLKGKRFYIAEYRVLFEVGGTVTASTRGGYLPGIDYGATRMSVAYQLPQPDIALLQQITDAGHADLLARLAAAGLAPEPADAFVQANGAVYPATVEGTRAGAEVFEDVDLGHGKRKYMVFAATGTRMLPRGFIGIGAGDIGKRMDFVKGQMEAVSVGLVVNLAAQESSGSGSSLFKRGSSANAAANMEVAAAPRQAGILQTHASGQMVGLAGPLAVPGEFATLREVGGYDTQKDAVVAGIQMLGKLTMGLAANNSKKVEMAIDMDKAAFARQATLGLVSANDAAVRAIR